MLDLFCMSLFGLGLFVVTFVYFVHGCVGVCSVLLLLLFLCVLCWYVVSCCVL